MFENLVDLTEPIYQNMDSELASMTFFDTSGIEEYVKENNPKLVDALMPSHADAEPAVKQMYVNGHFCFKDSFCISGRKTGNILTSESDLYLAGITRLITVLLADSIHYSHAP